jgi:hypothetical protein
MASLDGKYEPEARDVRDSRDAALTSIAVSLKRIADAMAAQHPAPSPHKDHTHGE